MASLQDILSLATTLLVLGVIVAGVMKVFQMASDIQELKEILKDHLRRNMPGVPNLAPSAHLDPVPASPVPLGVALREGVPPEVAPRPNAPTAEELVRAIHQQDFRGENFPFKD
jgi:hypothetical protein